MYSENNPVIAAMVLDSAFSDLIVLAKELVDKGRAEGLFAPGIVGISCPYRAML